MNCEQFAKRANDIAAGRTAGAESKAIFEHLASCRTCSARFERALREDVALTRVHEQFRRRHTELRKQLLDSLAQTPYEAASANIPAGWRQWMCATAMRRRFAWGAAIVSVSVLVALFLAVVFNASLSRNVLAQTAEALRSVDTFHFRIRLLDGTDQSVRKCWTRGNRTYCSVEQDDGVVAEAWLDPKRVVAYDKKHNRVVIKPTQMGLQPAQLIDLVRDFDPEQWQLDPVGRATRAGKACQVFRMPGKGTFSGFGKAGETTCRLWIDEESHLPVALEGLLKTNGSDTSKPFIDIEFVWDAAPVPEDLFKPKYPDTAKIEDQSGEAAKSKQVSGAPGPPEKPIATASWQDKLGVTLEKLWINPAGLLILRAALHGRAPFGSPPDLKKPEANPWGLDPAEIPVVLRGQVLLNGLQAERLGTGGARGRWAIYLVYRFEPRNDFSIPRTMTYRHLLARTRSTSDASRQAYINTVLRDPSSWGLYQMTVPTQGHITEQIPVEILDSPNLVTKLPLASILEEVLKRQEAAKGKEEALRFYRAQSPRVQRLLKEEAKRLQNQLK